MPLASRPSYTLAMQVMKRGEVMASQYNIADRPEHPVAVAQVRGGPLAPDIAGTVCFWPYRQGTWVSVIVRGLPPYQPATETRPPIGPHGFHLHEDGTCAVGNPADPFQAAGGHWNPDGRPHGDHAGDFPVLFSNNGTAIMSFYTDRFEPAAAVGKAVIIHLYPDDYRPQPAGAAGPRAACGVVEQWRDG